MAVRIRGIVGVGSGRVSRVGEKILLSDERRVRRIRSIVAGRVGFVAAKVGNRR